MQACALCNGKSQKTLRETIRGGVKRKVLKCLLCELIFLEPQKKETNFYEKKYREKFGPTLGHGTNAKEVFEVYSPFQKYRLEDIRRILSKKKRLLDVGCASGAFLNAVRPFVKEALGNEPNLRDAVFAKKLGLTVSTTPIEQNPFPKSSFDIATVLQTLEHIEDPLPFLKGIKRVLKAQGTLIVEVPNLHDWLLTSLDLPGYHEFYFREAHPFYYTPKTLRRMLKAAGFRGTIRGARYIPNIENQFHWIINDAPQGDARKVYADVENPLLKRIDAEYRTLVRKNLLSESILFIGQPQ